MTYKRKIYCPLCGKEQEYEEPEGACPIEEYPQCECGVYIIVWEHPQDYIVKQVHIKIMGG